MAIKLNRLMQIGGGDVAADSAACTHKTLNRDAKPTETKKNWNNLTRFDLLTQDNKMAIY